MVDPESSKMPKRPQRIWPLKIHPPKYLAIGFLVQSKLWITTESSPVKFKRWFGHVKELGTPGFEIEVVPDKRANFLLHFNVHYILIDWSKIYRLKGSHSWSRGLPKWMQGERKTDLEHFFESFLVINTALRGMGIDCGSVNGTTPRFIGL